MTDPDEGRAWWVEVEALKKALVEDEAEIARHHRDFRRISELVHDGLDVDPNDIVGARYALRQIRNIVG